jgi:hypothetical protein
VHTRFAHAIEARRQRWWERARPPEWGKWLVSHEQGLDGEVVAKRGHHRGDLDHTPPDTFGVAAGRVVAIEVHDDVE